MDLGGLEKRDENHLKQSTAEMCPMALGDYSHMTRLECMHARVCILYIYLG